MERRSRTLKTATVTSVLKVQSVMVPAGRQGPLFLPRFMAAARLRRQPRCIQSARIRILYWVACRIEHVSFPSRRRVGGCEDPVV